MEISAIQFTFENCEGITIPISCFSDLNYKIGKECMTEFQAGIKDNLHIDCSELYDQSVSPIQRISQNDITQIQLIGKDNSKVNYGVIWEEHNPNYNGYQKSISYSYTDINISINKKNYTEGIFHVLRDNEVGNTFIDIHGCRCKICENDNGRYLSSFDQNGKEIKTYLDVVSSEFYKE